MGNRITLPKINTIQNEHTVTTPNMKGSTWCYSSEIWKYGYCMWVELWPYSFPVICLKSVRTAMKHFWNHIQQLLFERVFKCIIVRVKDHMLHWVCAVAAAAGVLSHLVVSVLLLSRFLSSGKSGLLCVNMWMGSWYSTQAQAVCVTSL